MLGSIFKFTWSGSDISFRVTENGSMVNATEMAKPFGPNKRPAFWLRSREAKEFINALLTVRNLHSEDLIVTYEGGSKYTEVRGGTWMHEDVAIEFARWLNPMFAIWCNDRIKEILVNGYSVIDSSREAFERAYHNLEQQLNNATNEIMHLRQSLDTQNAAVSFCNMVFSNSSNLYTMTDIVKGLNFRIGRVEMYNKLEELGYMFKIGKNWRLKDPWSKEGFMKDIMVLGKDGKYHNVIRWTDSGRAFVYTVALRCGIADPGKLG